MLSYPPSKSFWKLHKGPAETKLSSMASPARREGAEGAGPNSMQASFPSPFALELDGVRAILGNAIYVAMKQLHPPAPGTVSGGGLEPVRKAAWIAAIRDVLAATATPAGGIPALAAGSAVIAADAKERTADEAAVTTNPSAAAATFSNVTAALDAPALEAIGVKRILVDAVTDATVKALGVAPPLSASAGAITTSADLVRATLATTTTAGTPVMC